MARKSQQREPASGFRPIEVPVRVDERFRPIEVQVAAPVAAPETKQPATGDKED